MAPGSSSGALVRCSATIGRLRLRCRNAVAKEMVQYVGCACGPDQVAWCFDVASGEGNPRLDTNSFRQTKQQRPEVEGTEGGAAARSISSVKTRLRPLPSCPTAIAKRIPDSVYGCDAKDIEGLVMDTPVLVNRQPSGWPSKRSRNRHRHRHLETDEGRLGTRHDFSQPWKFHATQ